MRSRAEHDLCLLARSSSPAWQCLLVRGSSPVRRAHVLSHRGGPDCGTHQAEVNALDSQRVGGHHVALLHLLRGHLVHRPALRQRRCKRTPTLVRPSARRLASKQAGSGSGQPHLQRLLWTRLRLPRPISLPRLLGRAGRPCRPCFCHDRRLQLCAELGEDDAVLATPPEVGSVRLASQRRGSAQCRGGQGAASAARPCHLGGERCHGNCTPKKQRTRQVARGFCLFGPSVEALSWPGTHEGTWSGPGWHHHDWHDLSEAWEVPIRVACSTAARRLPVLSRPGRSTTVIILNGVRTTRSLKSSTPARKGGVSGFTQ